MINTRERRNRLNYFTYNEYQECTQNKIWQKKLQKQKNARKKSQQYTQYNLDYDRSDQRIDFIIGQALQDPEEIKQFLQKFPLIQKTKYHLDERENFTLIPYTNTYQESVYFWPDKNLFFLFHYQPFYDSELIYSLLNSCISIFHRWKKENSLSHHPYPIIIPFIIDGTKDNNLTKKETKKINYTTFQKQGICLSYNVIKIEENKEIYFQKGECLLSHLLLLKKTNCLERKKQINTLIENTEEKEMYDQWKKIKKYLFKQ